MTTPGTRLRTRGDTMKNVTCEACGNHTPTLHPCPCGLIECPIAYGVCDRCRHTIENNAIQRRRDHARGAA